MTSRGATPSQLGAWSLQLMDRDEIVALRLGCAGFADGVVGREPFECCESEAEIMCVDQVAQVTAELVMRLEVEAFDTWCMMHIRMPFIPSW